MQIADERRTLALTYRLFGRLWIRELDAPLLAELTAGNLGDAFRAAGGTPPPDADPVTCEALAADYCRLLLGPSDHWPPYQSVWTDGQFQGQPAVSMRRYLDLLDPAPKVPSDVMPDHLGIQLDVMGLFISAMIAGNTNGHKTPPPGRQPTQAELNQLAARFFRDHLRWPGPLLRKVHECAETDFYRTLATVTEQFLESEAHSW
jgi:TorA maturation chaperone TorD